MGSVTSLRAPIPVYEFQMWLEREGGSNVITTLDQEQEAPAGCLESRRGLAASQASKERDRLSTRRGTLSYRLTRRSEC